MRGSSELDSNSTEATNATGIQTKLPVLSFPPPAPNYGLAAIFWAIFIVGVTGNLLLISVNVWRRSSKQAATQLFMISLSVSDLGLLLCATWFNAVSNANPNFYVSRALCKVTQIWSILAADGSVIILSIIGFDRFISLSRPGNCFFSARQAQLLIVLVWVVILAADLPLLFWFDLVSYGPMLTVCKLTHVDPKTLAMYFVVGRTVMFFVPLSITFVSYFGIWYKLTFSNKKIVPFGVNAVKEGVPDSKLSKKVARMCTLVVAIFAISWTPLEFFLVYIKFVTLQDFSIMSKLFILANANSCINPIIYGFMWKPMKDAVFKLLSRCHIIRPNTVKSYATTPTTEA